VGSIVDDAYNGEEMNRARRVFRIFYSTQTIDLLEVRGYIYRARATAERRR
jgi:hypothetical protein